MSRHWAFVIGINQYQFRQPLLCAHEDAQVLYNYLTQEAGCLPQQCILMGDRSPIQQGRPTRPTAENLKSWLEALQRAEIKPDDRLWIFFSGYGESWEGQDYLLPIDAETQYSPRTWLSLRTLYSSLKQLATQEILVVLDMNRSQSRRTDAPVGRQTLQLAKELGIATILSCQPEQYAQESAAIGRGLFTAAFIEGLRIHPGQPLHQLVRFLQARLPELSEHHNRPRQDPLIMVAPGQLQQWQVPNYAPIKQPEQVMAQTLPQAVATGISTGSNGLGSHGTGNRLRPIAGNTSPPVSINDPEAIRPMPLPDNLPETRLPETRLPETRLPDYVPPESITLDTVEQNPVPLDNSQSNRARSQRVNRAEADDDELNTRQVFRQVILLSGLLALVLALGAWLRYHDRNNKPALNNSTNQIQKPAAPAATPMPTAPSPDPITHLNVPKSPPADSAKILDDARAMIRPTNASEVQRAIERAMQIPLGDPRHAEAQKQIDRWCNDILEIAQNRADQKNFKGAIEAAKLIPDNRGDISKTATTAIETWRKRVR